MPSRSSRSPTRSPAVTARSAQSAGPAPRNLPCLNRADRVANAFLLLLALSAWAAVAYVFTTLDPRRDPAVLLAGALLLGGAVALTLVPLLWLAGFVRHQAIAYRGDWSRAVRRASLVGMVIVLFIILRAQDALSLPLAVFILVMAVLVELILSLRR